MKLTLFILAALLLQPVLVAFSLPQKANPWNGLPLQADRPRLLNPYVNGRVMAPVVVGHRTVKMPMAEESPVQEDWNLFSEWERKSDWAEWWR